MAVAGIEPKSDGTSDSAQIACFEMEFALTPNDFTLISGHYNRHFRKQWHVIYEGPPIDPPLAALHITDGEFTFIRDILAVAF